MMLDLLVRELLNRRWTSKTDPLIGLESRKVDRVIEVVADILTQRTAHH